MLSKDVYVKMFSKAVGKVQAEQMYNKAISAQPKEKKPSKVYLNAFGAEVHVNGDVSASMSKGETLQERIARFDKLSERVAAIRYARAMGMLPEENDGPEEDVNDFSKLDDVEIRDDFGDIVEKPSFAKPAKAEKAIPAGDDAADGANAVADDESAGIAANAAAMPSDDED